MKFHLFLVAFASLLIASCSTSVSQVKLIQVNPHLVASDIQQVHGPNIALYDSSVPSQHKLIFMIEGTGASAMSMHVNDRVFAAMGFHVISVDYENNIISTVCEHSKDSACSYDFRKEIITGEPLSNLTNVDSANSLLNRFSTFLQYLVKNDPRGGWEKFLEGNIPRWEDIIVAGHSQGSGHAALLGKMFKVNRVLIFSGPQDYLVDLGMPSPWLSEKGATPEDRYYAFLSLRDPFNIKYQIADCDQLMGYIHADTLMVSPDIPIKGHFHILVNDISNQAADLPVKYQRLLTRYHLSSKMLPHLSTLFPEYRNVWAYMLGIKYKINEKVN